MPKRTISVAEFGIVCILLILATILTVAISFIPLGGVWHIVVGLSIAACKGSLVILFFMHLLVSSRVTWIVVSVVCFWVGIMVVLTMGDYLTRDLIPFVPGH